MNVFWLHREQLCQLGILHPRLKIVFFPRTTAKKNGVRVFERKKSQMRRERERERKKHLAVHLLNDCTNLYFEFIYDCHC